MDERQRKGREIALTLRITIKNDTWLVPSQTAPRKKYKVLIDDHGKHECTCEGFKDLRPNQHCKHIWAVINYLEWENGDDGWPVNDEPDPPPKKPTYRQSWPEYRASRKSEKPEFRILLKDLCRNLTTPPSSSGRGRPRALVHDMVWAMAYKVYCGMAADLFWDDLQEAYRKNFMSELPKPNSILNYMGDPAMTPVLEQLIGRSSLPLNGIETKFVADSSGFSTCRHKRWFDHRKGRNVRWNEWIKAHIMCGVRTNVVTAVQVTKPYFHDSPELPGLLDQTVKNFDVKEVSADKAYSSVENLEAIEAAGAQPLIPFKRNATEEKGGTWRRLLLHYLTNEAEFNAKYHLRSNVESTFSMIKRKFGEQVYSKKDVAMKNEVLLKILGHNLCCVIKSNYVLGVEPDFWR